MGKKVLFISGSIGLGHVTRDLAIAKELRKLVPDIDISWLASHPASRRLEDSGERLLPESDFWVNYTTVAEKTARGGSFNLITWLFKMRKDWVRNVELFKEILRNNRFDLTIGDETYEISVAVTKNPAIIKIPYIVIYDFIGLEPTSINPLERLGIYLWNRKWAMGDKIDPFPIDMTLFDGELEDIPDKRFGFLLPKIRDFARSRCEILGYIINADFNELKDQYKMREKLGYGNAPLIICSIGGTAVGRNLLDLCARAYPLAAEKIPNLKMVLICGPRLDPQSFKVHPGIEVKGYIPCLIEHFAACDLAILQAGGTSTLELTALRRPFLYFPLERHFEQQIHVAGRLARHGAGVKMSLKNTTPKTLAESIIANIGKEANYDPIPVDGARNAAVKIRRFLE